MEEPLERPEFVRAIIKSLAKWTHADRGHRALELRFHGWRGSVAGSVTKGPQVPRISSASRQRAPAITSRPEAESITHPFGGVFGSFFGIGR